MLESGHNQCSETYTMVDHLIAWRCSFMTEATCWLNPTECFKLHVARRIFWWVSLAVAYSVGIVNYNQSSLFIAVVWGSRFTDGL